MRIGFRNRAALGFALSGVLFAFPAMTAGASCSPADQIALAKSGYTKADIEKMCSAPGGAGTSTSSDASGKSAAAASAKATSPKAEPKPAAATAADSTQVLKDKTEAAAQAFKTHDYINAAHLFSEVVALNPNDALAWHFLGQSLANKGDIPAARKAYNQSLKLAPTGEIADRNRTFLKSVSFQDFSIDGRIVDPSGISADGLVVVGTVVVGGGYNAQTNKVLPGTSHIFRWTQAHGEQNLGAVGEKETQASGVSADGSVIIGTVTYSEDIYHVLRWTQAQGLQDLGTMGGESASPKITSSDGSQIIGFFHTTDNRRHVFRWTQTQGAEDLGAIKEISGSTLFPTGVSADGKVVIGVHKDANNIYRFFRWTATDGTQDLGVMGGKTIRSAHLSADGSTIAGTIEGADDVEHVFRWTQSTGAEDLGTMGGKYVHICCVSADGSVVVGSVENGFVKDNEAVNEPAYQVFRWTSAGGVFELGKMGAAIAEPRVMTRDGLVFAGTTHAGPSTSTPSRAFIYYLPSP